MSTNLVRMRNAAIAVKTETTVGTDAIAGTPAGADWLAGDVEIQFDQNAIPNPEMTGSLDRAPSIAGGIRPTMRIKVALRGSGTPGTAPEWGRLMTACTMAETVTGSAVGVPTAAAAGSTTSVTLASPAGTTAQQYRGMPLLLTGNVTDTTGILDYTTGRVATIGSTLASAASGSTNWQIPINVRYAPTSDESVFKTATIYFFADGMRYRFTGCMGTWTVELSTGGLGFLTFTMRGDLVSAPDATALPAGALSIARPTPPRFVNGKMQLNKLSAQTRMLTVNAGVNIVLPDDPEAPEGVGPAVPVERAVAGNLDPLMNTSLSPARFAAFQAGTSVALMAIVGTVAGNRFLLTLPSIRKVQMGMANRDGLGVDAISFEADGADASAFLAQF